MKEKQKENAAQAMLVAACVLVTLDYVSTLYGLEKGRQEANPLIIWLAQNTGMVWAVTLCKAADIGILVAFYCVSRTTGERWQNMLVACLKVVTIAYAIVVTNNAALVMATK